MSVSGRSFTVETSRTRTDYDSKKTLARYLAEVSVGDESLNRHMREFVEARGYSKGIGA